MCPATSSSGWISVALGGSLASGFWWTVTGAPVTEIEAGPVAAVTCVEKVPRVSPTQASNVRVTASRLVSSGGHSTVHWYSLFFAAAAAPLPTTVGSPTGCAALPPTLNSAEPLTGKNPFGR